MKASLDDRLLDFSYKLTDILSTFHTAIIEPSLLIFEQLNQECSELIELTDYIIERIDRDTFENNSELGRLLILSPLVDLINKMNDQAKTDRINRLLIEYPVAIMKFTLAIDRFTEFITALNLYLGDSGCHTLSHYLPERDKLVN